MFCIGIHRDSIACVTFTLGITIPGVIKTSFNNNFIIKVYMDNFEYCVGKLLDSEGGYVNDPADPGGATHYGISLSFLKTIRPNATLDSIINLSIADAKAIYKEFFWNKYDLDQINEKDLAATLLKLFVNAGPSQAAKITKRAINSFSIVQMPVDDRFNNQVILHLNQMPFKFFRFILIYHIIDYYRTLCNDHTNLKKFLLGWLNRVFN